jgi:hypothetical protein
MRRFFANAALVVASVFLCLVVGEIGVRMADGVPVFAVNNFVAEELDIIHSNSAVMAYDATLGWRLTDNYATGGRSFSTGAYGVRMNGATIEPVPSEGILAVGDSFTAGSGVADDEAWPAQLEQLVHQPVVNGAAGAWGVDQMVLRAEQLIPVIRPTTLIVSLLADDSLRNNFEIYGGGYKPYFTIADGKAVLQGVPVPRVTAHNVGLDWSRRIFGYAYFMQWVTRRLGVHTWWVTNDYRYKKVHDDKVGVDISCLLMDRLTRLRDEQKIRVIVMVQYGGAESQGEPPWYGPPVVACARAKGLDTVDTYPPLHALWKEDPARFRALWIDEGGQLGHMSAAGNKLIAELVQREEFPPPK